MKLLGIKIGDYENKILLYADDITGTVKDTDSAKALLDLLYNFEKMFRIKNE